MINHISLTGQLKEVDAADPTTRYLEVVRNYKNADGEYPSDRFPCRMWTRDNRNSMFSYKTGTMVALDGRLETEEGRILIIVEAITYLFREAADIRPRSS